MRIVILFLFFCLSGYPFSVDIIKCPGALKINNQDICKSILKQEGDHLLINRGEFFGESYIYLKIKDKAFEAEESIALKYKIDAYIEDEVDYFYREYEYKPVRLQIVAQNHELSLCFSCSEFKQLKEDLSFKKFSSIEDKDELIENHKKYKFDMNKAFIYIYFSDKVADHIRLKIK